MASGTQTKTQNQEGVFSIKFFIRIFLFTAVGSFGIGKIDSANSNSFDFWLGLSLIFAVLALFRVHDIIVYLVKTSVEGRRRKKREEQERKKKALQEAETKTLEEEMGDTEDAKKKQEASDKFRRRQDSRQRRLWDALK